MVGKKAFSSSKDSGLLWVFCCKCGTAKARTSLGMTVEMLEQSSSKKELIMEQAGVDCALLSIDWCLSCNYLHETSLHETCRVT